MKARSLWTVAPGVVEHREHDLREPGVDEVLVETRATGISRGTERLVFEGRVPETQWAAMRAPLQYGDFPFPLSYGYAAVGVVRAGAAGLLGQRVFVLHPHHDRFIAPAAMCTPVPASLPDRRAVLAANMETAVNILWDARPLVGERALVIGAGVVGLLVTYLLARIPGLDLHVCDPDTARGDIARAFGASFCAPEDAPGERDLIIHASANPAGLRLALGCAGFEGRILEASWFGAKECALPLGEAFHAKRLALISTQVGQIAPAMRGRRAYADRLALALSLLADPALDALLGPDTSFAMLPQSMGSLLTSAPGAPQPLCPVVTYL